MAIGETALDNLLANLCPVLADNR